MLTEINSLGYRVLSKALTKKVMGKDIEPKELDCFDIALLGAGLPQGIKGADLDFDNLPFIPPLLGDSIAEHFENMAKEFVPSYDSLLRAKPAEEPTQFLVWPGWVRYTPDGLAVPVEKPLETEFIYDCETFVKASVLGHPIIGTALSSKAYYIWLHPALCKPSEFSPKIRLQLGIYGLLSCQNWEETYIPTFVSIGTGNFVVMHNTGYDAARVIERYTMEPQANSYFCTMSAQNLLAGGDNNQRWYLNSKEKPAFEPKWASVISKKSLVASYEYWTGEKLAEDAKDPRKLFVDANHIDEFRQALGTCLEYALHDCTLTLKVFQKQMAAWGQAAPSAVVMAGHLIMANGLIPLADDWHSWVANCEQEFIKLEQEAKDIFHEIADDVHNKWRNDEIDVESDPWLKNLDWSYVSNKPESTNYKVAKWYKDRWLGKKLNISSRTELSHYLLRLTWLGEPIYKVKDKGWCYGPNQERVWNKKAGGNTGTVLTKDFMRLFEDGTLASSNPKATRIIELTSLQSYWIGYRKRIAGVATYSSINPVTGEQCLFGAPFVVPHNTLSGRSGEPLWLTVAGGGKPRIGSEVKYKVQPPAGYKIVGFDVDSEELQIARCFADSYAGVSGSTQFSFQVLAGTKEDETDMHWAVAKMVGVSRMAAKQSNYAMLYGGGVKTIVEALMAYHPTFPVEVATQKATELLAAFKGSKVRGGVYFEGGTASGAFNKMLEIVHSDRPASPILDTWLPRGIWPEYLGQAGTPSQLNTTIQSSGSTYGFLSCLCLAVSYLFRQYNIDGRLGTTLHDELFYIVREEQAVLAAYLMQMAHLWCWSLQHYKLGIHDIPAVCAFASFVNIDNCWRKSPTANTITPTHSLNIEPGVELNMSSIVQLVNQEANQGAYRQLIRTIGGYHDC